MKFLLDENAELRIAAFLRQAGHDVTAIAHDYPPSLADHDVLAIAVNEGRILITNDRDFGETDSSWLRPAGCGCAEGTEFARGSRGGRLRP